MNIQEAINCKKGQTINHLTEKNKNGSPYSVRVNGKCKTWKTRPNEFRLPVKRGLYEFGYITEKNAKNWVLV